jgi:hypothetical protein
VEIDQVEMCVGTARELRIIDAAPLMPGVHAVADYGRIDAITFGRFGVRPSIPDVGLLAILRRGTECMLDRIRFRDQDGSHVARPHGDDHCAKHNSYETNVSGVHGRSFPSEERLRPVLVALTSSRQRDRFVFSLLSVNDGHRLLACTTADDGIDNSRLLAKNS